MKHYASGAMQSMALLWAGPLLSVFKFKNYKALKLIIRLKRLGSEKFIDFCKVLIMNYLVVFSELKEDTGLIKK